MEGEDDILEINAPEPEENNYEEPDEHDNEKVAEEQHNTENQKAEIEEEQCAANVKNNTNCN